MYSYVNRSLRHQYIIQFYGITSSARRLGWFIDCLFRKKKVWFTEKYGSMEYAYRSTDEEYRVFCVAFQQVDKILVVPIL
jgi:hypothetical protein